MGTPGRDFVAGSLSAPGGAPPRAPSVRHGWIAALMLAAGLSSCTGLPTRPMFGPAASGPLTRDIRIGVGAGADSGMVASIHYTMRLEGDSRVIDSTYGRGRPFSFTIGTGIVIRGLDLGILGMRVGGLRELVIPPELAYGSHGIPPVIPPNSTLVMRMELIELSR